MRKTPFVLAALLAVAGICVMLWPAFTGHRLQSGTDAAVQSFLEERKPEQQYPELLAALQEYNRQLYTEKQRNLTDLEACEEPAADLTVYGIEDEIIGVLEIPAMHCCALLTPILTSCAICCWHMRRKQAKRRATALITPMMIFKICSLTTRALPL